MSGMTYSEAKRTAIVACARSLGVRDAAIDKWFQRGVPGRWHLKLLAESERTNLGLVAADLVDTNRITGEPPLMS